MIRAHFFGFGAGGVVFAGAMALWAGTRASPHERPPIREAHATQLPVTQLPVTSEPVRPLPAPTRLDARRIRLGDRLFHDPGLSADKTIACASCHDLEHGGADTLAFSLGIGGQRGGRNAPTVYNSGLNFRQFWDGRAATLEEQVDGPLTHPKEMGASWQQALAYLEGDPTYERAFREAYSAGISRANVSDAIATFERSLVTTGSRFDKWLAGDGAAIDERERRGYELFKAYGCASCHQGANVGGNLMQKFGVLGDYFGDHPESAADRGAYDSTNKDEDMYRFRVPSLRLAALTPPYFHDGSVATLDEAVALMATYQLGRDIPIDDRDAIVAFLRTLLGATRTEVTHATR